MSDERKINIMIDDDPEIFKKSSAEGIKRTRAHRWDAQWETSCFLWVHEMIFQILQDHGQALSPWVKLRENI